MITPHLVRLQEQCDLSDRQAGEVGSFDGLQIQRQPVRGFGSVRPPGNRRFRHARADHILRPCEEFSAAESSDLTTSPVLRDNLSRSSVMFSCYTISVVQVHCLC